LRPVHLILVTLLFLTGCGGPAALTAGPAGPPIASWTPPGEPPRAVIVALHGFSDYSAAFDWFGAYAAAHGVLVEAYDQPGFGARPDRGRWPGTVALVEELDAAVAGARRRHPGVPLYVLGESMGGAVAVAALARPDSPPVDGLILAAPAVWDGESLPKGYRIALRFIAGLVPPLRVSGRHLDVQASDNVDMLRALGRDPLYLRDTRIDAVAGLVELMDQADAGAPHLAVPILVLLGGRDEIVPPPASRRFVAALPARRCKVITYVNGWHLLLRDHQRERVFADILGWIADRAPPSRLDHPCRPGQGPAEVAAAG
jgi:alpha-beta hydrolase superfamily lysophospholipase